MTLRRAIDGGGRIAAAAAALAIGACVHPRAEVEYGTVELSPVWSATVRPVARDSDAADAGTSAMRGEAMMMPGAKSNETMIQLGILNVTPGTSLLWHMHGGRCGSGGRTVGPASSYPPLVASPSGTAGARVTLPFATPGDGQYHVDVHDSSASPERILLCGDLQRLP